MAFFHSEGNFPFSKHDPKIMPNGLQIDSSQIFSIQILIISWPRTLLALRFLIFFKISYVKNSTDESDLHAFYKEPRKFAVNKRGLLWKEVIKEFSIFLEVFRVVNIKLFLWTDFIMIW